MSHVTMIHGIGNKLEVDRLLASWEFALRDDSGIDLETSGVSTSMVYWADVLYESPSTGATNESVGYAAETAEVDDDLEWIAGLPADQASFVEGLAGRIGYDASPPRGEDEAFSPVAEEQDGSFERIPLPWFVKRRLMKALLRDVHHYLFNATSAPRPGEEYRVQDEIRQRFVATVKADRAANDSGPHIVMSHSMGTVIAYDCLKRVAECPAVDGLMTIGSPLGLDEVQDMLQPEWSRDDGFPSSRVRADWVNVFDNLDVVAAFDPKLANDFRRDGSDTVGDVEVDNPGKWKHDIAKYLRREELRSELSRQLAL